MRDQRLHGVEHIREPHPVPHSHDGRIESRHISECLGDVHLRIHSPLVMTLFLCFLHTGLNIISPSGICVRSWRLIPQRIGLVLPFLVIFVLLAIFLSLLMGFMIFCVLLVVFIYGNECPTRSEKLQTVRIVSESVGQRQTHCGANLRHTKLEFWGHQSTQLCNTNVHDHVLENVHIRRRDLGAHVAQGNVLQALLHDCFVCKRGDQVHPKMPHCAGPFQHPGCLWHGNFQLAKELIACLLGSAQTLLDRVKAVLHFADGVLIDLDLGKQTAGVLHCYFSNLPVTAFLSGKYAPGKSGLDGNWELL
mmetsp:Transcript_47687/g.107049  ORF Transcript_47687/g.107049 Transcript_47687/m.107049 type:complete len:306 (-) Transcript_47687:7-924(-)